jgi:hypothetical protein
VCALNLVRPRQKQKIISQDGIFTAPDGKFLDSHDGSKPAILVGNLDASLDAHQQAERGHNSSSRSSSPSSPSSPRAREEALATLARIAADTHFKVNYVCPS